MNPAATPLPDIRDIVPPQPYFLPAQFLWLALAAVAAVAAGWCASRSGLRRTRKIRAADPAPACRDAPGRICSATSKTLEPRKFGGEVCDVLRIYIGSQYGLHPERQTSPEFLEFDHRPRRVFSPAEHGLLADFLEHCDLLKFARADATLPQAQLRAGNEFLEPGRRAHPAVSAPPAVPPPPGSRRLRRLLERRLCHAARRCPSARPRPGFGRCAPAAFPFPIFRIPT